MACDDPAHDLESYSSSLICISLSFFPAECSISLNLFHKCLHGLLDTLNVTQQEEISLDGFPSLLPHISYFCVIQPISVNNKKFRFC